MITRMLLVILGLSVALVFAQTTPTTDQPAPPTPPAPAAPPAAPVWSVGPIEFSGLVDAYYAYNPNHPATQLNGLRNFDVKANQFSLNMIEFGLAHAPDPIGFEVDFGFGRAFDIIHGSEKAPQIFRNLRQAFISIKPPKAKGLQVDFGEFVTSAGAEVIETHSNWNYSRSLLYSWAIPYYHFGVRSQIPLNKYFSAGLQVVNGWNNIEDNNSGKTVGLVGAFTTSKFAWTHVYYVGPEKDNTNKGWRHLYDTTLLLTPNAQTNFYINFDYGMDKKIDRGSNRWVGIAGAARFAPTTWIAFTPRLEWFNDADGFQTGMRQKVKEFTMTGELKMAQGLLARLEYRRDWSNQPFFDRGSIPASTKNQDTVLLGFVAFFGPKR